MGAGFGVWGSGFRVQASGFIPPGSGFRVHGAGCRVQGAGCRVQGAGCRVQGVGCCDVGLDRVLAAPDPRPTPHLCSGFRFRATRKFHRKSTVPCSQGLKSTVPCSQGLTSTGCSGSTVHSNLMPMISQLTLGKTSWLASRIPAPPRTCLQVSSFREPGHFSLSRLYLAARALSQQGALGALSTATYCP